MNAWNRRSTSGSKLSGRTAASLGLIASAGLFAAASPLRAQPNPYVIDAAHSYVDFQIHYLGIFTFGGRFSGLAGTLVFDRDNWSSLESQVRFPVSSLEAHPSLWRSTLLGPVYFDEPHFPMIAFSATHAGRTGPTTGEAAGTLTIRGTTQPVALSMHLAPGEEAIDISAETMLKRSSFALGGTLPFASDDVSVVLRLRVLPLPQTP
jgi:polyisoprenoid-binding protein YceI